MPEAGYDFLVVGAGPYGAAFARRAADMGKKVLVIDRKPHTAGHIYTEVREGIPLHVYGAHIFHTQNTAVWEFVNRFSNFNRFTNSPVANFKGKLYNLPFNMNTFYQIWGVRTPDEARAMIDSQRLKLDREAVNLEEQALSLVGRDVYDILVKEYTEKQWGKPCSELPAFLIRRLPLRFTFDNNYFNDPYQGIPAAGYTPMIDRMLEGIEVRLNLDYLNDRSNLRGLAKEVIYTGQIDAYFDYDYGPLEYRSLRFETEVLEQANFQGVAVMNYTAADPAYTRIIEHKHFYYMDSPVTVISREYPASWKPGDDAYYPVNDERNHKLYNRYRERAEAEAGVYFGGRLGQYKYFNMDQVIAEALELAGELVSRAK